MILYEKGTTNFTKNGFGYITDVLSAKVTDELNGEYSLVFEYPTSGKMSEELTEGRIVKCKVSDGTMQCFIIKNIVKTYDKMTITCSHLFYLLLDDFAEDIYPQNLSPKPFFDWILARANYQLPFVTTSDVSVQKTGRYVRKNLVEIVLGEEENSMINLFGIEIKRNNFNLALNSRIGADRGEKLIYGKNITGINVTTDANSIYTRIMPIGYDGLLLPEKYIDATNINDYPYPKIGLFEFSDIKYDPNDEDAYHTLEEAYTALRAAVQQLYDNGVNLPQINIKVDWLELSKTEEYKNYSNLERVELGDTIHAEIFGMNYETRVIKTIYNPLTDLIESFEIGSLQPTFATQMNKYDIEIQNINPASILEEAQSNATSLITQAMGGYVYKTNNELYIMDNPDPNQAVHVWRWNINGLGYSSTGINGTYGLAMTMDGAIVADFISTGVLNTSVIQGYDSLTTQVANNTGQISILTQSVGELNSKIQDIADITTSAESTYGIINLTNVNESQPIMIKIHPTRDNISYLYPRNNLYPSNDLYSPQRTIQFKNTSTNEIFLYELQDDLLFYNEDTYDEFYWDYDSETLQIIKKCKYNADGSVGLLSDTEYQTYTFPEPSEFYLTTGNYEIRLLGYNFGYIMVRAMASNIYTSQFATRSELSQTASNIRTEVSGEYATKTELQTVDSRITQTATSIESDVAATYATKEALATTNSTITQTADSITSSVAQTYETKSDAQTSYDTLNSTITQKANEINIQVAHKVGDDEVISKINLSEEDATIDAPKINIGGVITAVNNDTTTTINGNKITTGSITASQVNSSVITTSNFSAQNINASKITSGTLTSRAINNGSGTFSVTTGGYLTAVSGKFGSWTINGTGIASNNAHIYPDSLGFKSNGTGGWTSQAWWLVGKAASQASDKRLKKNIKPLEDKYNKFFDGLNPVSFNFKKGDTKGHIGFIAQEVDKSAKDNDLELDLVFADDKGMLNLDKREIIALNTWQIQMLKKEIQELKEEIKNLKGGK